MTNLGPPFATKGTEVGYARLADGTLVCLDCGGLVHPQYLDVHETWHRWIVGIAAQSNQLMQAAKAYTTGSVT